MTIPWPADDEGAFFDVKNDLVRLGETFFHVEDGSEAGELFLPDGFETLVEFPLTNGSADAPTTAVPWEYVVTNWTSPHARLRGEGRVVPTIVVRGVTIVTGTGDDAVFRRYVDWAGVWAQLGVSSGRGEIADTPQRLFGPDGLGPDGEAVFPPGEPDVT